MSSNMSRSLNVEGVNVATPLPLSQVTSHPNKLEEGAPVEGASVQIEEVPNEQMRRLERRIEDMRIAEDRRDAELNGIPLVFVGLLASTISSAIIFNQPQLRPNPGDETVALLRVILYNINHTAFGGEVPTLPGWKGAPATLFFSQIILYCCLIVTFACGLYLLMIKFFTDSHALGWKNKFIDQLTRWTFVVMYSSLGAAFFGSLVAITLQVLPFPSTRSYLWGAQ